MWDAQGKAYIDLIGGISVCNIGHRHPKVIEAVKQQADQYMHIMVYGELVENPQVNYARLITNHLPKTLNAVFFTTSGSEATEGAMKLAKRHTGRSQIISFKNSYHGSTQGSLSLMGSEYWKTAYRPLLPDVLQLRYNNFDDLENITDRTAAVFAETIQAEAGVISPKREWIRLLRKKCTETGALLVLDEIQCGFGRNGSLWAFELFGVVPDILLLGKALGGGMPLGAFVADKSVMDKLTLNPVLGHINTFGGHPVCCAAGLAGMQALLDENLINEVEKKGQLFEKLLLHQHIKKVNRAGLMLAVHFQDFATNRQVIHGLVENGVFTDWFLFAPEAMRIVPPLVISEAEIKDAANKIHEVLNSLP